MHFYLFVSVCVCVLCVSQLACRPWRERVATISPRQPNPKAFWNPSSFDPVAAAAPRVETTSSSE